MRRKTFNNEMNLANVQGEVRESRALNWTYISLGLIILTFISVILGLFFVPNNFMPNLINHSNTSSTSVDHK